MCGYTYICIFSGPPLSAGDVFQGPQWMPGTIDSSKPYISCVFFLYIRTYDKV